MDLSNKRFALITNESGLAADETLMVFDSNTNPYTATYTGPNIEYGHAIASLENDELVMLYHAMSKDGKMSAGKATVSFALATASKTQMQLHWQWLTGDLSSGSSKWIEVNAK